MTWLILMIGFFLPYISTGLMMVAVLCALILSFYSVKISNNSLISIDKFSIKNIYIISILYVFLMWLVSAYYGIDDHAFETWGRHFFMAIAGVVLYLNLKKLPLPDCKLGLFLFQCIATFFSMWAIFDHALIAPQVSIFLKGEDFIATYYSSILAMALPFSLWACALLKNKWHYCVPFIITTAIFTSGGRSGWLALIVMLAAFIMFFPFKAYLNPLRARALSLGSIILGAVAGLALYWQAVGTDTFITRSAMSSDVGLGTGRLDIWRFSWENFLQQPIWGIGPRNFRNLDFTGVELVSTYHPHNIAFELLVETGVMGFIAFMLFVILIIAGFFKALSKNPVNRDTYCFMVCSFSALAAYGAASMTLTSLFHGWWFGYLILLCVFIKLTTHKLSTNH